MHQQNPKRGRGGVNGRSDFRQKFIQIVKDKRPFIRLMSKLIGNWSKYACTHTFSKILLEEQILLHLKPWVVKLSLSGNTHNAGQDTSTWRHEAIFVLWHTGDWLYSLYRCCLSIDIHSRCAHITVTISLSCFQFDPEWAWMKMGSATWLHTT